MKESGPLTVFEAAEMLGISPYTVRAWIGQGRLGSLKLGRAVRVPITEVERLLSEGLRPAHVA